MLKFISFGSGSCGNCYYLSNGRDALLIDSGVGIKRLKRYFREYGVNASEIAGILITHDHTDHIKAAGYVSAEFNLKVYSTPLVNEAMHHGYYTIRKVDPEHEVMTEKNTPFHIKSFTITAFNIPHDSAENVGYFIEWEGESFCIMTDVGSVTDDVKFYIGKSKHLVIEANYDAQMLADGPYPEYLKKRISSGTGHMCNTQTADVLAECFHENLKTVWLCHLSAENNHPVLAYKTVEMNLRAHGIIAGADFNLNVLRRESPTGPWEL